MIIGAQKAGTSALSHFLSQHTDVCMAEGKEVHLFDAPDYSNNWTVDEINQRYAAFFEGASESLLWGEATPIYLYWSEIIPALKRYNPALKLIVILRDPSERAISHYEMEKSRANETLPLWLALWREPNRLALEGKYLGRSHRCHSYVDRGLYVAQLEFVRQHFDDEQILVLESDELKTQHMASWQRVCEFLSIDSAYKISAEQVFVGNYENLYLSPYRWLVKIYLRWKFRSANLKLKALLVDMGINPNWRWLK